MNAQLSKKSTKSKSVGMLLILGCIVSGSLVGLYWEDASLIEPIGTLYINLLLCAVVPLVFCSIVSTIGSMSTAKESRKTVLVSICLFFVSSLIAVIFAFLFLKVFPIPKLFISVEAQKTEIATTNVFSLMQNFLSQSDFYSLFSIKAMMPMITAAIIFGFSVQKCGGAESSVGMFFTNLTKCLMETIQIINRFMPIGLFCLFASLVSKYGSLIIKEYMKLVIKGIWVETLYLLVAAPLYVFFAAGKSGLAVLRKHIWNIIPVAFGTSSSVATVPVSIKQADDSGIPKSISSMVISLGANMNMNGSAIHNIIRIFFLASFFGKQFTSPEVVLLFVLITVCSILTPGVSGGSKITSSILLTIFFPDYLGLSMALISPIGKILDPFITVVNATMDYVMSFVVTRLVKGKDWMNSEIVVGRTET